MSRTAPKAGEASGGPARTPGDALRRRRRALALTGVQLAAALGCSTATLSHAETGTGRPARPWWSLADGMTGAGGELLRLYDGIIPEDGPVWPAQA
jgi:transcriptional regulator with XRE-family HTH domain